MRIPEIMLFYMLAAMAVGIALHQQGRKDWLSAIIWPLALPSLLAGPERFDTVAPIHTTITEPIARLQHALTLLSVATDITPLGTGIADLQARLTALDKLLKDPELRPENRDSLAKLRERLDTERQATLHKIDDLVTTIHLAHYGGKPLDSIDGQLADLLARVEGVAEVRAQC